MRTCLVAWFSIGTGRAAKRPWRRNSDSNSPASRSWNWLASTPKTSGWKRRNHSTPSATICGRGTTGQVGLDVEDALPIDAEHDEGRVVAAAGVAALAGIEGQGLDHEVRGPLVEPDRLVEVATRAIRRGRD